MNEHEQLTTEPDGWCPNFHRPCPWGCGMECYLEGETEWAEPATEPPESKPKVWYEVWQLWPDGVWFEAGSEISGLDLAREWRDSAPRNVAAFVYRVTETQTRERVE